METHLPRLLAICDVEAEWTDRRPHARADAITDDEAGLGNLVECIAGVNERRNAPVLIDPARPFHAADDIVAPGNGRFAVFDTEAFETIAAHRCVAAGAEQQSRWHLLARR